MHSDALPKDQTHWRPTITTTSQPVGIVTLLLTDIEGSTRLAQRLGDAYGDVLARFLVGRTPKRKK